MNEEENFPKQGARVAKIYRGWGLYVGLVIEVLRRDNTYSWKIRFEDGEEEEMDYKQVQVAVETFTKAENELKGYIYDSWERMKIKDSDKSGTVSAVGQQVRKMRNEMEIFERQVKDGVQGSPSKKKPFIVASKRMDIMEVEDIDMVSNDGRESVNKIKGAAGAFLSSSELSRRMEVLLCQHCGCDFTSTYGLKYHQDRKVCLSFRESDTVHAENFHHSKECPTCQRQFTSTNAMRYHLERATACMKEECQSDVKDLLGLLTIRKTSNKPRRIVKQESSEGTRRRKRRVEEGVVEEEVEMEEEEASVAAAAEEEEEQLKERQQEHDESQDVDVCSTTTAASSRNAGEKKRARVRAAGSTTVKRSGGKALSVVSLPGVEGGLNPLFDPPPTTPLSVSNPSLSTNIQEVKRLLEVAVEREEEEESQQQDLNSWLRRNSISVETLVLKLQGATRYGNNGPQQMSIPPFQGIFNPEGFSSGSDVLINACGPVYAMDLLKANNNEEEEDHHPLAYLALGATCLAPKASTADDMSILTNQDGAPKLHVRGRQAPSPNLVQVYAIPNNKTTPPATMHMLYAMPHEFGPVWDVKWAPSSLLEGTVAEKDSIGLLAVVFGDGKMRLFLVPKASKDFSSSSSSSLLLPLHPLVTTQVPAGACLTCVRFSPHDPGLFLCGATNGVVLLYRLQDLLLQRGVTTTTPQQHGMILKPIRRFYDARENCAPGFSSVDVVEWHPVHPRLFLAAGHDLSLRVWDVKRPFSPLLDRSSHHLCHAASWLPNGVGCLAGFANGAVRCLSLPEDVFKVRIYRHESFCFDGVWSMDTSYSSKYGTLLASTGADGKLILIRMELGDLISRRSGSYSPQSTLLQPMRLYTPSPDGPIHCEMSQVASKLVSEMTEVSASGELKFSLRAALTKTTILPPCEEKQHLPAPLLVGVAGFSGLVRVFDAGSYLSV